MKSRIQSIDLVRGIAILLMALDHVRDFIHADAFLFNPTDLSKTNIPLFFTRFITHFCAPVFCLLAGTSIFMVGERLSARKLSAWLLKRGLVLIALELTIVKIAWYFYYRYDFIDLGVIWSLGICMVAMAALIHLPKNISLFLGIILLAGHNMSDNWSPAPNTFWSSLWMLMHVQNVFTVGKVSVFVIYPFVPWLAIMLLGYHLGRLYRPEIKASDRIRYLRIGGLLLIALFFLLRIPNVYGDLLTWAPQASPALSFLAILNVSKYPPSLLYACITLGPALLLLAQAESWKGAFAEFLVCFGQVPMFFYLLHLYLIHLIALVAVMISGYPFSSMILEEYFVTEEPELRGFGGALWEVYWVWIAVIALLYVPCRWYRNYKKMHPERTYLSYL